MNTKKDLKKYSPLIPTNLSSAQLGQMFVAGFEKGSVGIKDLEFTVKSNGKTGMEIRYFINLLNA
jgi:hypothetical protein